MRKFWKPKNSDRVTTYFTPMPCWRVNQRYRNHKLGSFFGMQSSKLNSLSNEATRNGMKFRHRLAASRGAKFTTMTSTFDNLCYRTRSSPAVSATLCGTICSGQPAIADREQGTRERTVANSVPSYEQVPLLSGQKTCVA